MGVELVSQYTQAILARTSNMMINGPFGRRRLGVDGDALSGFVFMVSWRSE